MTWNGETVETDEDPIPGSRLDAPPLSALEIAPALW
jgi:hypothetical protein